MLRRLPPLFATSTRQFHSHRAGAIRSTAVVADRYLVTAYDFADAWDRRQEHRPAHLANADRLKDSVKFGGPMLSDDKAKMIGSVLIIEAEGRNEVEAIVAQDPYTTGQVWDPERISIHPFKVVKNNLE